MNSDRTCVALIRLRHLLPRARAREKATTIESDAFYLLSPVRSYEWEKVANGRMRASFRELRHEF